MIQTKLISDIIAEPVSLSEAKEFMEIDFCDFDNLISRLIKSARQASERFTGLSYGLKEYALASDQCSARVPFGPFIELLTITDKDGITIPANEFTVFGLDNPIITVFNSPNWNITYKTGFEDVPDDLKIAICMRVETAFKYRADSTDEQVNKAINTSTELEFAYRTNPMF